MKTYHERTQDILERIETYKMQKRQRRKQMYTAVSLAACLTIVFCAAIVFASFLHQPVIPPGPISGDASLPVSAPAAPPAVSSRPGAPHFSISQKRVSFEEAKQALGWNIVPGTEDGVVEYVLLSINKPDQPVGLFYRYPNGFVRILSVTTGETNERDYQRMTYQGKEFLVPHNSTERTALYRDGNVTYTASLMGVTQEEAFDRILSLLIT